MKTLHVLIFSTLGVYSSCHTRCCILPLFTTVLSYNFPFLLCLKWSLQEQLFSCIPDIHLLKECIWNSLDLVATNFFLCTDGLALFQGQTIESFSLKRVLCFSCLVKFKEIFHVTIHSERSVSHLQKGWPITVQEVHQFVLELMWFWGHAHLLPHTDSQLKTLFPILVNVKGHFREIPPAPTTGICAHISCFPFGHHELTVRPAEINFQCVY